MFEQGTKRQIGYETLFIDVFSNLDKNEVEKCQLVCLGWTNAQILDSERVDPKDPTKKIPPRLDPVRKFTYVHILRRYFGVDIKGNSHEIDWVVSNAYTTSVSGPFSR
jgi:hypothetical protein